MKKSALSPSLSIGLVLGLTLLCNQVWAAQMERIALVVGNTAYAKPLESGRHDAKRLAERLQQLGYDVSLHIDVNKEQLINAINSFNQHLGPNQSGLFYYSGHGVTIGGRNYMVPLESDILGEPDIEYEAVNIERVISPMRNGEGGKNLVILDLNAKNESISGLPATPKGPVAMDAPNGSLIFYAAKPGQLSRQSRGKNGLFTQILLEVMSKPRLTAEEIFSKTAKKVKQRSNGRPTSWREGALNRPLLLTSVPAGNSTADILENDPDSVVNDDNQLFTSGITEKEVISFIQHYFRDGNNGNIDSVMALYADRVNFYSKNQASRSFIRKDKLNYLRKWPSLDFRLIGEPELSPGIGYNEVHVVFRVRFKVYNPKKNRGIRGIAKNMMTLRKVDSHLYITSEKQKVLSRKRF